MKHLVYYLRQLFLIAVPLATGYWLLEVLSPWLAVVAAAAIAVGTCGLGALLLRSTVTGSITWRNHLAGWLLPWGYFLGRGQLPGITAACSTIWTLLATSSIVARATSAAPTAALPATAAATAATPAEPTMPWLLVVAWVVNGAAMLYLLKTVLTAFGPGTRAGMSLWRFIAVLAALIAGSVVLQLSGNTGLATLVAGGPPLLVGGFFGLWMLAMIVFGRNARWN